MQTVYRLELHGKGVYRARGVFPYVREILDNYNLCDSHCHCPGPHDDKTLSNNIKEKTGRNIFSVLCNDNTRFGFTSSSDLINWFGKKCLEELMEIAEVALLIVQVPEDKVITGDKQCLYSTGSVYSFKFVYGYENAKKELNILNS